MYVNSNMQGNCHVGGSTLNTSTVPVYDNNWHDMVCLRRGNTIELYFDNVLQSSSTPSQITNLSFTGTTAYLGKSNTGGAWSYHKGTLDEVKVLVGGGTGLTQAQVPGIFSGPTNAAPTLTVTGQNPLIIQQGSTYTDPGATAVDAEDGTLPPASITSTGTVNTAVLGTYTLTYTATDSAGQAITQARTVAVVPPGPLVPNEVQTVDYYAYGQIRNNTQAGAFNEQKKFTGYEYDQSSDLNYAINRYYDGNRGQFISQDPLVLDIGKLKNENQKLLLEPQRQNAYSYADNNPLRYVDRDGKDYLEVQFGGMLPIYGILGISGTLGLRADTKGVDVFYSAGPSIGAGVNVGASWVPEQTLSHKPEITVSNQLEVVPVIGMTIGREGEYNAENPSKVWKNPKNTTSLNAGFSAGVSGEVTKSRPLYMFRTGTQSTQQSSLPTMVIQGSYIYIRNSSGMLNYYGSIPSQSSDKKDSSKKTN